MEFNTTTMEDYYTHSSSSSSTNPTTTYRQYNPYQDLQDIYQQPSKYIYNLPSSPELLFQEDSVFNRSFTSNIAQYTGLGYLSGAFLGATKGGFQGLVSAERGESLKLRVSRVLNCSGHSGRKFGNSLGSIGLIYAGVESYVAYMRDTEDSLNSVLAGIGTGAIYRVAAGPRSAVVAGVVGGLVACAANTGKHVFKRYVPI